MERGRKHHNLRHVLPPAEQAAALAKVGGGPAATLADAGERILSAKQKELQQLFGMVYGCPTSSFNNEWLRRKLLTAVGLPPNWRPPPELAPELPPCRPEECSRYGRRRRRVASYALPESSDEAESGSEREASPAPPRAIRRRTSSASLASARREGSADSAGAGVSSHPIPTPALAVDSAGWRSDGPTCSGAGTGSPASGDSTLSAIFAMQARAAAAFASHPPAPAAPSVMVPVHSAPQPPLSAVALPAGQPPRSASPAALPPFSLPPLVPAAPAAQPAGLGWGTGRSLAVAPAQPAPAPALPSLAALLSSPSVAAAAPAPRPLAEQLLQPASALDSLSAQLHMLFEDWEAGHVSLLPFGGL